MDTSIFQFVTKNAIAPILQTEKSRVDFIKAIMGDSSEYDWGEITFELDQAKRQYEIVAFDIPLSMIYWPSYEEGLANAIAQMSLASMKSGASFEEVLHAINLDFKEYIDGRGQWCYWGEEYINFYSSFKKLANAWLADDTIEADPEKTRLLLKRVGLKKAEQAAKQHATSKNTEAYSDLEEFLTEVEKS